VAVEPALHRALIGQGGSVINRIQRESGANVRIVDKESADVVLTGTREACDAAAALIEELLSGARQGELPLPPEAAVVVIGRNGATIRRIEAESGVKSLRVRREDNRIVATGTQAAVDAALAACRQLIEQHTGNAVTV